MSAGFCVEAKKNPLELLHGFSIEYAGEKLLEYLSPFPSSTVIYPLPLAKSNKIMLQSIAITTKDGSNHSVTYEKKNAVSLKELAISLKEDREEDMLAHQIHI